MAQLLNDVILENRSLCGRAVFIGPETSDRSSVFTTFSLECRSQSKFLWFCLNSLDSTPYWLSNCGFMLLLSLVIACRSRAMVFVLNMFNLKWRIHVFKRCALTRVLLPGVSVSCSVQKYAFVCVKFVEKSENLPAQAHMFCWNSNVNGVNKGRTRQLTF